MNHDEVAELAAAYALGALDGEERTRFEALLAAGDADARAALRDFESTVATLAAETAESPPPAVKSALMARIDAEERSRGNVTRVLSMPRSAPPRRSLWSDPHSRR
jgi:anti-sigma-K factor RskA